MVYPKHIKCKTKEGTIEWVVRLYDEQMEDGKGGKIKTPENLLNRYYTANSFPKEHNLFKDRKVKSRLYLKLDEVMKVAVKK